MKTRHSAKCIYCEHGPYCVTCPPPPVAEGPVCGACAERIRSSELAADPYFRGDDQEMYS